MCTYACAYVCTCCCTTPLTTKTARTFHHAWPSFFLQTPLSLISNSHLFSLITHIPLAALINTGQAYAGKAELSRATSVSYTAYQTTGCGWMSMTSRVRVCVCVAPPLSTPVPDVRSMTPQTSLFFPLDAQFVSHGVPLSCPEQTQLVG